jgi:hypothetical protein
MWAWGRVHSMEVDLPNKKAVLNVITGPAVQERFEVPPWKLIHCHHQPQLEFITVNGKRIKLDPADDSEAWRLTREAITRAMTDFSKYDEEDA